MRADAKTRYRIQGTIAGCPLSHRVIASVEWERDDPRSISAELAFLGSREERLEVLGWISNYRGSEFVINYLDDEAATLQLRNAHWLRLNEDGALISAFEVRVDFPRPEASMALHGGVTARLVPSGILTVPATIESRPNGCLEVVPLFKDPVLFNVGLGNWRMAAAWDTHEDSAYGNRRRVQTERAIISGELSGHGCHTMEALHEQVETALSAICTLLSLCYRQPVHFYEVQYLLFWDATKEQPRCRPQARYNRAQKSLRDHDACLIGTENLVRGGFQRLMDSYHTANAEGGLSQAIAFLSSSYDEGIIETKFLLAFTTLELLVGICGNKQYVKLPGPVKRSTHEFLRTLVDKYGCVEDVRIIRSKLGDLLRPPIADRIIRIIEERGIETADIYPIATADGVRAATRIRNDLVHKALVRDYDDLVISGIRIRALAERLLLHLLQWPMEQLDHSHNRELSCIIDKECVGK